MSGILMASVLLVFKFAKKSGMVTAAGIHIRDIEKNVNTINPS